MSINKPYAKWLMPIFWQIFLGFFMVKFFIVPLPFKGMWISLALLLIYLVAYFWGYFASDNKKLASALVMVICGIIAVPYNWGASVFFQFSAIFIGVSVPPQKAIGILIGLIVLIFWLFNYYELPILNFLLPAVMVSAALGAFGIFERNNNINKIRTAQNEAEIKRLDAIAERERIARDLHDILGHTLTVITLKLNVAKKMLTKGNLIEVEKELNQLDDTARSATKSLQDVISNYKDLHVADEVNNLILLLKQLGYEIESHIELDNDLNPTIEETLSLIIRESVTNIIRHAQANHCKIELKCDDAELIYKIKDNGTNENEIQFGHGLNGMQNRIEKLAGKLIIRQKNGTELNVIIPVNINDR